MEGKLCVVTGATDGIGRVTARALAERGGEVVLVGRNAAKGAEVCKAVHNSSRNSRVRFEQADLSSQAEIRALAERLTEGGMAIDVLVNNVGAMFTRRRESVDGIEMTFALNHLGYFLLTGLLLKSLKANGGARIVNVASEAHRSGRIDLEDPQGAKRYRGWPAYSQSKLANIPLHLSPRDAAGGGAGHGQLPAPRLRRQQVRPEQRLALFHDAEDPHALLRDRRGGGRAHQRPCRGERRCRGRLGPLLRQEPRGDQLACVTRRGYRAAPVGAKRGTHRLSLLMAGRLNRPA